MGFSAIKIPKLTTTFSLHLDIPAWLRSLRLHKYTTIFEGMQWNDIIKLNDDELNSRGVSALGARRKLLKVFEMIKAECQAKVFSYVKYSARSHI
jgi:hypothetical protein